MAHAQLCIRQYLEVLLSRAVLSPFLLKPVLVLGIAPTQLQDLSLVLVEPQVVHMGPLLKFKNGFNVSIFTVTRHFTKLLRLFSYHGEWPWNYISQYPQDFGMRFIMCHIDLCVFGFLRWSQTWHSLTVGGLCSLSPHLVIIHLRGVVREVASED